MEGQFSSRNNGHNSSKTLMEVRAEHKGESYPGEVIDADPSSGENPVINPGTDIPNIIVNGEKAKDYKEGDRISLVKVTSVHESDSGAFYMFGERIKSDEEREQETANEYAVTFSFMGNSMESETFQDEQAAEDFQNWLQAQLGSVEVEVAQKR